MNPHKQSGFSLIELLVGITVGLILLAGVARIFLNSKQGYRIQESAARLQENSRFAVETLSRSVRMADFWAGVPSAKITNASGGSLTTGTACTTAGWRVNPTDGVHGYAGAASAPTVLDCISDYVANSDILVLRYADADDWAKSADLCGTGANTGYFLKSLIGKTGLILDATATTECTSANALIPGEATNGVLNYRFKFIAFWLRTCSTTPCSSTADGGVAIPSLVQTYAESTGLVTKVVAEGVEMLKFEYGVDTNGDKVVDRYYAAGGVTNWSNVLTIRVSMIVRGDTLDSFTDTTTYNMTATYGSTTAANYSFTPTNVSPDFAGRHQRRLVVKELQIRNRLRQS